MTIAELLLQSSQYTQYYIIKTRMQLTH